MPAEGKLFLVKFKMNDFVDAQGKAWGSVPITLFAAEENRQPLVPYEVGIKNYNSGDDFLKEFSLRCLFSEDEAQKLANYISEKENFEAEMSEFELPIDSVWPWLTGLDANYQGFMGVNEAICAHMGFLIAAYYDVRESEKWKEMNS
jgi:hypothetical protein